jgi:hypothetical protein
MPSALRRGERCSAVRGNGAAGSGPRRCAPALEAAGQAAPPPAARLPTTPSVLPAHSPARTTLPAFMSRKKPVKKVVTPPATQRHSGSHQRITPADHTSGSHQRSRPRSWRSSSVKTRRWRIFTVHRRIPTPPGVHTSPLTSEQAFKTLPSSRFMIVHKHHSLSPSR